MSRWKVFRYKSEAGLNWMSAEIGKTSVMLLSRSRAFLTWREAQDYADRMARTREVVLPRISHSGDWVPNMPTIKIGWEHHPVYFFDNYVDSAGYRCTPGNTM